MQLLGILMSGSSLSPINNSSEDSSVPLISPVEQSIHSNATAQCPNKKRERSTSEVFVRCVCDSPLESGSHIGVDLTAEAPNPEYMSLLKDVNERTDLDKSITENSMKQSPSSGALNELLPSEEKVDPSIGSVKSRRTCRTKSIVSDPQETRIYDLPLSDQVACSSQLNSSSASLSEDSTSSYSSSYTVGYSDYSAPELTTNAESKSISIAQGFREEESDMVLQGKASPPCSTKSAIDISEAVNILRIDSTKELNQLGEDQTEEHVNNPRFSQSNLCQERNQETLGVPTCFQTREGQIRTQIPDNYANINPEKLYSSILISKGYKNANGDTKSIFKSSSFFQDDFFATYSPDQIASYSEGSIVSAVRRQDVDTLRTLHSEGMHMQCSNRFGESIVHLGCRLGSKSVVKFLLDEAMVSLRVRDDMGRTPMHDACWMREPNFELMDMLVQNDPDLLMIRDGRGFSPLSYVRREHWCQWCDFLLRNKEYLHPREL